MRTRTRLLTAAAALAATGSFIVGTGPAAMAQPTVATCWADSLCLYTQDNYGGKNNSGHSFKLYSGKSDSGTSYTAKHDSSDGDISNNKIGDNNAESIKRR